MHVFIKQSSTGFNEADIDLPDIREEQESLISGAGNFDRIIGAVSSYWDRKEQGDYPKSINSGSESFNPILDRKRSPFKCPQDDRVGFLDLSRGFDSIGSLLEKSSPPAPIVHAEPQPSRTISMGSHTSFQLPSELRMITYSDDIPKPDLPVPPAPALPNLNESPLNLLIAASGGKLDLNWLETFDNSTLETLVPRDPYTGRPLTIGSIEHPEGKCRPCIFFLRAKCFKGLRCTFCHFNHTTLRRNIDSENNSESLNLGTEPSKSTCSTACGTPQNTQPCPTNATGKSKRLRPSKRTREMIKQINEQILFGDFENDPNGPPLSVTETLPIMK
jgi:hypothetical protein